MADDEVWPEGLEGLEVEGRDGQRIGAVRSVYADDVGGAPEWVSVHVEDSATPERLVPLAEAALRDDVIEVPYARDHVLRAPLSGGAGHLTSVEEAELYAHYDVEYRTAESETGLPTAGLPPASEPGAAVDGP